MMSLSRVARQPLYRMCVLPHGVSSAATLESTCLSSACIVSIADSVRIPRPACRAVAQVDVVVDSYVRRRWLHTTRTTALASASTAAHVLHVDALIADKSVPMKPPSPPQKGTAVRMDGSTLSAGPRDSPVQKNTDSACEDVQFQNRVGDSNARDGNSGVDASWPIEQIIASLRAGEYSASLLCSTVGDLVRLQRARDGVRLFDVFRRNLNSKERSFDSYMMELRCLSMTGNVRRAFDLCRCMRKHVNVNRDTYHMLISMCARKRKLLDAIGLYERMLKDGLNPNRHTLNLMISACGSVGDAGRAKFYFDEISRRGFKPDEWSFSALLYVCRAVGLGNALPQVLAHMKELGISTNPEGYNTVLNVLLDGGQISKATELFEGQERQRELQEKMENLHREEEGRRRRSSRNEVGGGLWDSSAAHPDSTHNGNGVGVFDGVHTGPHAHSSSAADVDAWGVDASAGIPAASVESFNSMIGALLRRGDIDGALRLYESMRRKRVSPTAYTFAKLIRGCNDPDRAVALLEQMRMDGVVPSPHVYASGLFILSRAGRVANAFALLEEMRERFRHEDTGGYNALLDGFRAGGHADAAMCVVEMMRCRMVKADGRTVLALVLLHARLRNDAVAAYSVYVHASHSIETLDAMLPATYDVVLDSLARSRMWSECADVASRLCGEHLVQPKTAPTAATAVRKSRPSARASAPTPLTSPSTKNADMSHSLPSEEGATAAADATWTTRTKRLCVMPSKGSLALLVEAVIRSAHSEAHVTTARRLARYVVRNVRRGAGSPLLARSPYPRLYTTPGTAISGGASARLRHRNDVLEGLPASAIDNAAHGAYALVRTEVLSTVVGGGGGLGVAGAHVTQRLSIAARVLHVFVAEGLVTSGGGEFMAGHDDGGLVDMEEREDATPAVHHVTPAAVVASGPVASVVHLAAGTRNSRGDRRN